METNKQSRSKFIKNLGVIVGLSLFAPQNIVSSNIQDLSPTLQNEELWLPLNNDEIEKVKESSLANCDVKAYVKKGYKCGQILVERYCEINNLSSDINGTTIGLGDRCCLLTSAIIIFGLHISKNEIDIRQKNILVKPYISDFWEWWKTMAPLNCEEISPRCISGYPFMYARVALKVEEIIASFN